MPDSLYIDGIDRTNYLKIESPEMEFQLNTRAMFNLEFLDTAGVARPSLGQEVFYTKNERAVTVSGTATSPVITSAAQFLPSDEGKVIVIPGAGVAGATLSVFIRAYVSASQVGVEFDLDTTVAGASARIGERKFGGHIVNSQEEPFYADVGIRMQITCADYNASAEQPLINGISSGPNLRDHVDWSLIVMTTYGTRRDPNMALGANLGVQGFGFIYVMEVWKRLSLATGWVFFIDCANVVRWYAVGDLVAPIDIDGTVPLINTLKISQSYDQYRNDQWVWFGGSQAAEYTETQVGNSIQRRWTLEGAPVGGFLRRNTEDGVYPSLITIERNPGAVTSNHDIGREGVDVTEWTYNPLTNELVHVGGTTLDTDDRWTITYINQFPLVVNRTNPTQVLVHGLRSQITTANDTLDRAAASAYADDLLRRYARTPRIIEFDTYNESFLPGQQVTVNLTSRALGMVQFLVDSVTTRDDGSGQTEHLIYSIHAIEGEEFQNLWPEFFRDQNGGALGGSGTPGPAAPPPSETEVQYVEEGVNVYPYGAAAIAQTTSASAWTNVTYTEIIASTPDDWLIAGIALNQTVGAGHSYEVDIAVGSAGNEIVRATFRLTGNNDDPSGISMLPVPIGIIPSGSRVAMRVRYSNAFADAIELKLYYYDTWPTTNFTYTGQALKSAHPSAAGAAMTLSASSWVNNAFVQVSAATPAAWAIAKFSVLLTTINNNPLDEIEFDIAVGEAGLEEVIATIRFEESEFMVCGEGVTFDPCISAIPQGARVSVCGRHSRTITRGAQVSFQYYELPL
jgi:hypothetical protein